MINRTNFFNKIKVNGLFKTLKQSQVIGITAILDECEKNNLITAQTAYVLATIYHEVDKTMQPIEEYGKGKNKTYGYKVKYSGKPYFAPDKIYYGRGFTQTTWFENYEVLTKKNSNGWDFLNKPELLLQVNPSIWATVFAMKTGLYTGKKLSDYIDYKKTDFINARRIINSTDKALLISQYANNFLNSLK